MKHVLLTLLMAGTTLSYAVPVHKKKTYISDEQQYAHEMAWQKQNARIGAKGTATMRRLVATTYRANGVLIDTNSHIYSGARGSVHSVRPETYYDVYSMMNIESEKTIFCDTTIGWYDQAGLVWDGTSVFTYDAANNTTSHLSITPYIMMRHDGVYNSSNKLVQITTSDTFGGTALLPKTTMYITYDGNGRRLEDSTVVVATGSQSGRRTYSYDANGNMVKYETYSLMGGQTLQIFFRALYTYDSQGRVVTEINAYNFGGGMMNIGLDSYAYAGNAVHPIHHRIARWDDVIQEWEDYEMYEYTLNAQAQPDTYIIYRYINQWDTVERDVYQYDSHGLLLKSNGYIYMGNGQYSSTPYDQSSFYYEEYDPATVARIAGKGKPVLLAPNPARDHISFEVEQGYTSVAVVNSLGQVVRAQNNLSVGKRTINVDGLPAGNYILIMRNVADGTMSSAKFIKQ